MGWWLTGTLDLLDSDLTLSDYKSTSVFSFLLGDKIEWENQINVYAYLLLRVWNIRVKKLQIVAFLKDWSKRKSSQQEDYPKHPVLIKEVPLWSIEDQEQYIQNTMDAHQDAERQYCVHPEIFECSNEERWHKPDLFCVKKIGNKRSIRNYESEEIAKSQLIVQINMHPGKKFEIECRKGEDVRCESYCNVSKWCPQRSRAGFKGEANG